MNPVKPIGTLSAKGYVHSIVEKTDRVIAHFFASDAHQDYIYEGQIANCAILLQECGNNILQFRERLRSVLERYLENLYDSATVQVWDDSDTNLSDRVNVSFAVQVTQGGERYDVANLLTLINGKFEKITKLNNTGSAAYL
jgi:hypothetical protein